MNASDEHRRAGCDRGIDEIPRRLAPDALVLAPRARARHLAHGWDLRREVDDRIVAGGRGAHRRGIEEVDAHRTRAQRLHEPVLLDRPRHRGHVAAGGREPGHDPAAQHTGRTGDEHPHRAHGLVLPVDHNPDIIYPD